MEKKQKDLLYVVGVSVALALMIQERVMEWPRANSVPLLMMACFAYLLYWRIKPLWKELGAPSRTPSSN